MHLRLSGGACDLAEMLCCWRSGHANIRPIGDESLDAITYSNWRPIGTLPKLCPPPSG